MIQSILTYLITTFLGALIGFLLTKVKSFSKKEKAESEALKMLLQSNLTNTYFAYEKIGAIPDYIYQNWLNLLKSYEALDGDDYVHILAEKIKNWKIETTDILKK